MTVDLSFVFYSGENNDIARYYAHIERAIGFLVKMKENQIRRYRRNRSSCEEDSVYSKLDDEREGKIGNG